MGFLKEKDRQLVREEFKTLADPVKLVMFTQEHECDYCHETRELLAEVASLSDKLTLEVHDFQAEPVQVGEYQIDKIPALSIVGRKDYGVRYYGIPSGYEFSSLIEDILMVSHGESGLSEGTRQAVKKLTKPVHIQVFVTPT